MKLTDYLAKIDAFEHFKPIAPKRFIKKIEKLIDEINAGICEEMILSNESEIQNLPKDTEFISSAVTSAYSEFSQHLKEAADNLISQD